MTPAPIFTVTLAVIAQNNLGQVHLQSTTDDWDAVQDVLLIGLQQARHQAKEAAQQRVRLATGVDVAAIHH